MRYQESGMGVYALLPVLLSLSFGRHRASAMLHMPALQTGDKAGRHLEPRAYDYYTQNGYKACQHTHQLAWLQLHRKVSSDTSAIEQ